MSEERGRVVDELIHKVSWGIAYLHNFGDEAGDSRILSLLNCFYKLLWIFNDDLKTYQGSQFTTKDEEKEDV